MRIFFFVFVLLCETWAKHLNCPQVSNFLTSYVDLLLRIENRIAPVNEFCSDKVATELYTNATYWFNNATHNATCREKNLDKNRLNIVQLMYDQMSNIWETAHCQDCKDHANETTRFKELSDQLDSCIHNHTKESESICTLCADDYNDVQHVYGEILNSRKGSICFDIEDSMNQTRYKWSATYKCCKDKRHSQTAFISFASAICMCPLIFYAIMYFTTIRREANAQAACSPLVDDSGLGTSRVAERSAPNSTAGQQADEGQLPFNDLNQEKSSNLPAGSRNPSDLLLCNNIDTDLLGAADSSSLLVK